MYEKNIAERLKRKTRYGPFQVEVASYLFLFFITNMYFLIYIKEKPYTFITGSLTIFYLIFTYYYVFKNRGKRLFFPQTLFILINSVIAIINIFLYLFQSSFNRTAEGVIVLVVILSLILSYNVRGVKRLIGISLFVLAIILYYLVNGSILMITYVIINSLFLSGAIFDLVYVKKFEKEYFSNNDVNEQFYVHGKKQMEIAWLILLPILTFIIFISSIAIFFK